MALVDWVSGTVVGRAEMHLERAGGGEAVLAARAGTVVRAGKGTVQQFDAVEFRGFGDTVNLRGHLLEFAVDDEALGGIVGAGGGLFGQFLHADEFFVNDGQRAVGGLDQGDGVIGVACALAQGRHVGPHEFPDGKARRIIRRLLHPQARGHVPHGIGQCGIMGREPAACAKGHEVGMGGNDGHAGNSRRFSII